MFLRVLFGLTRWRFALALFVAGCGTEPSGVHDEPVAEDWLEPEPTGLPEPLDTRDTRDTVEPLDASLAPSEAVVVAAASDDTALTGERTDSPAAPHAADDTPSAKPRSKPLPATSRPRPAADPAPSSPASPPASAEIVEGDQPKPPAADVRPETQRPVTPPAAEAKQPAAPVDPLGKLPGKYQYAGGQAQRGMAADAVESVVEQMNVVSRGIARRRLLSGVEPPRTFQIEVDANRVVTIIDGRTYQAELGGGSKRVSGSSGEALQFKVRSRRDQLLLEFRGKKGGKKYVMRVDGRGRLQMRVTIFSDSLPASVVYPLTYRAV